MFLKWRSFRRGVTSCACEPEWPGLRAPVDGHEVAGEPSPDGSSPLVVMLGLVAFCTGCGAEYPHGWKTVERR